MAYYGIYSEKRVMLQLNVHKATLRDIPLIEEWIEFHDMCDPIIVHPSQKCNWLPWDYILSSTNNFEGEFFKLVSNIDNKDRIEGIIHLNTRDGETIIEGLEIAPWNRELYLGNEREFRRLGLILIGHAIIYGKSIGSCGRIRLESLEVREPYYRDGLRMHEISSGEFIYTESECDDFIGLLVKYGMLR